jgi:hypothetical protein
MTTETKTQQWTPGAMKAADLIADNFDLEGYAFAIAEIISRETLDAEMAELLRLIAETLCGAFCDICGKTKLEGHSEHCYVLKAERLLAQIAGGKVNCEHPQCCICLKRECQQSIYERRFKTYGGLHVCGNSCLATALAVAYNAACRLGGVQDKPCGRETVDSAATLSQIGGHE